MERIASLASFVRRFGMVDWAAIVSVGTMTAYALLIAANSTLAGS